MNGVDSKNSLQNFYYGHSRFKIFSYSPYFPILWGSQGGCRESEGDRQSKGTGTSKSCPELSSFFMRIFSIYDMWSYRNSTGAILMLWKEHERLHCLNNLGQWWYFVVFAVVLMCVNLGNEKCGIQPRFRNRLLGWKNKSIMIQLAKNVPINIIVLNFCKIVTISAIWNCYLKRSPFLWSSPWWRPELRGHSLARWNGL